ncbi:MAG: hypothetical protein ACM3SW_09930 [Actinomycetota bacterium]
MANVNVVYTNGTWSSNNYTVPTHDTKVSFRSPDADCVLCFSDSQTFNQSSLSLTKSGNATDLTINSRVNTNFSVNSSGYDCSSGRLRGTAPTYTITMGSGR